MEVRGIGPLRLPVTAGQAKQLRLIARPARYGKGSETLLDRRVRDTWEVPQSRVTIDGRRWANTMQPMLDLVRDDLGLASTSSLDADLHSLLVYEPGQFFAAHQDSETHDDMIGSLVVLLPSRSTGGELVVSHRGQTVTYRGSATALTFVAFYADTRHEVLPLTTGYRIALTYNLRLSGDSTAAGSFTPGRTGAVAALLQQHFSTPVAPRWRHDSEACEPPDRLVFLLDHHYSEHSLRWPQLKGEDATRAALLRDGAEEAECDVALALAEIRETWDCEYGEYRGRRGWSGRDDHGPDPDDINALGDLIDTDIEIRPGEGRTVGASRVIDAELATATPTVDLEPYDTEYTGNMGNYGNTMDRWYRRAAVVIWPHSRAFAVRAKGGPVGALDEVLALSSDDSASREQRADMVRVLLRFWPDGVRVHDQRTLLPGTLVLAADLGDAELGARLLQPFELEAFTPSDACNLLRVADRYGRSWFEDRLTGWMRERGYGQRHDLPARNVWTDGLDTFCRHLLDDEASVSIETRKESARAVLVHVWGWLRRTIHASHGIVQPSARRAALGSLGAPSLAVLHAAAMIDAIDLRQQVIDTACDPDLELTPLLLATIRASSRLTAQQVAHVDLEPFARHGAETLRQELACPDRDGGDWSITGFRQSGCCQDCAELAAFLADPDRQTLVWPMAKPRREHIHRRIDEAELPVTHQTRREGSPHKLVLTKTVELFRRDAERRATARTELDTIERFLDQPRHGRSG